MVIKKLIICPGCEAKGKKEVLGEINSEGDFVVLRFHQGETKVISKEFSVKCGRCGETVFYREGK